MNLTQEQLDRFEVILRERALRKLARYGESIAVGQAASDGDISQFRLHAADQGTDSMEREKSLLLASEEGRLLYAINEALRRLYTAPASFGTCASCGASVGLARLDALPYAEMCIGCQTALENGNVGR
jgi:RNA polymerase-binding transcription factor DksA